MSIGSRVKTGHGSKRVIFKWVNRVTGQTGCGSNGSGQTGLTRFAMSKENTHEMALLKEQMAKMIRMMQQLVVRGN